MEEMTDALMAEIATTGEVVLEVVLREGADGRTLVLLHVHPRQAEGREESRTHVPDPDLVLVPKTRGIGHL